MTHLPSHSTRGFDRCAEAIAEALDEFLNQPDVLDAYFPDFGSVKVASVTPIHDAIYQYTQSYDDGEGFRDHTLLEVRKPSAYVDGHGNRFTSTEDMNFDRRDPTGQDANDELELDPPNVQLP